MSCSSPKASELLEDLPSNFPFTDQVSFTVHTMLALRSNKSYCKWINLQYLHVDTDKNELHKVLTRISVGFLCHGPSVEQLKGPNLLFSISVCITEELNIPLYL